MPPYIFSNRERSSTSVFEIPSGLINGGTTSPSDLIESISGSRSPTCRRPVCRHRQSRGARWWQALGPNIGWSWVRLKSLLEAKLCEMVARLLM